MKETKFNFLHNIYSKELIHCADIHLWHSDLFLSQNWTEGHRTYVRLKLNVIGHFVRRPCKRYFKAWCDTNYGGDISTLFQNHIKRNSAWTGLARPKHASVDRQTRVGVRFGFTKIIGSLSEHSAPVILISFIPISNYVF